MELVTKSFATQALAFPARVDQVLAEVTTLEGRKELLDKAAAMQEYASRLKAGIEIERPIAIGVLKIKAGLGELMPRGRVGAGRGNKTDKPIVDFSLPTISAYRKLADNKAKLDEYYQTNEDVPSQTDFIRWCTGSHVSNNSGEQEWYTPPEFIEAARKVLGTIDLDPASSDKAQEIVKATDYLTVADDGLMHDWKGRVWMNPPYASGLIDKFMLRLKQHYDDGDVKAAITLTNNATDTAWFQSCAASCVSICLVAKRIKYLDGTGEPKNSPLQGQVFMYFGRSAAKFGKQFEQFGTVWVKR